MRQALLILPAARPSRVSSLPRRGKAGRHQTSGAQVMCSPLPTPSPPPWGPGFAEEALARLVWHKAPWFWPGAARDGQEEAFPPALWLKLSQQGEVGLDVPVLGQAALLARSSLLQQVGELWGCSHRLHPGKKHGPACTPPCPRCHPRCLEQWQGQSPSDCSLRLPLPFPQPCFIYRTPPSFCSG